MLEEEKGMGCVRQAHRLVLGVGKTSTELSGRVGCGRRKRQHMYCLLLPSPSVSRKGGNLFCSGSGYRKRTSQILLLAVDRKK